MKIRRIGIRNFRKLVGPVVIDGLGDGLTVIAGDNEEGKSTVLAALQTVFFNRHRLTGDAAQAMQPFGSQVRPEIAVTFELDGGRYALRKAFCQSPEAELDMPVGRVAGDAVEETLQDLLKFDPPGRGAAKAEHQGVWGLFWVEQGTSFARPHLSGRGRETLTAALESEVGQVLGGERGRALLAAVEKMHEAVFTSATGRPRGEYKDALERVETRRRRVEDVRARFTEYESKIDKLGRIRLQLKSYAEDGSLVAAERTLEKARHDREHVEALQRALEKAEDGAKLAAVHHEKAADAWRGREAKIRDLEKTQGDISALVRDVESSNAAVAAIEGALDEREDALESVKAEFSSADADVAACEQAVQRARAANELAALLTHYRDATVARDEAVRLRAAAAAIRVDQQSLEDLRRRQKKADEARLRLQTTATRLEFAPAGERQAIVDGVPQRSDAPLLVSKITRIDLEGYGAVTVTPGGEDLTRVRKEAKEAEAAVREARERLGVTDVGGAEVLAARRAELLKDAQTQDKLLSVHAPDGIDALEKKVAAKRAEHGGDEPPVPPETAETLLADARARRAAAQTAGEAAERSLKAAEKQFSDARECWITAGTRLQEASRRAVDLETVLDEDRRTASDDALREALTAATVRHEAARHDVAGCERALTDVSPEEVRLRLSRAEQALSTITADIAKLTKQANDLEIELRALGQSGLGEELAEKEGELQRAEVEAERVERRAKAVRLLLETLSAAEREAKEMFLEPIRRRLRPYLRLLFPDAELVLRDDDLAVSHLRRSGVDEPFEALSVGTREQLAVLTRIAFADYLRDKGRPAAIVLDDALAYADDARFDRMQLVLRKAAEHLQIILLTCRERDYRGVGAPIIRLADCQTS